MAAKRPRPVVLMILDGLGERAEVDANAVRMAKTPALDALYAKYPHGLIGTSGPDVGLPPGQMGNSEVGHLNFGAGRIALMDIMRIDNAVVDHSFAKNEVIRGTIDKAKAAGGKLHLMGLVSDGGVHSHITHLGALIDAAHELGVDVVVHAFLDGRDVLPGTAPGYLETLEGMLKGKGRIGTVSGRYWAMDRDNRWERVERAYEAIVHANAPKQPSAIEGTKASIAAGKTDEFVEPFVVDGYTGVDTARDAALHFNFRPDRARELTRALATEGFTAFTREAKPPFRVYACMTTYDSKLGLPIAFPKETYPDIFPEVIAKAGLTQFRCAETEKYAHVTYFFNGGREEPFHGEERTMIPSPKDVATYDLKPEMGAAGVADAVVKAIESDGFDFVVVNFANPDMVGHTGNLDAAITAVEAVDAGIGRIADAVRAKGGALFITADHGNCELMKDPATGAPHTAHTLNPVPLVYVDDAGAGRKIRSGGRICDVAPTMLELMGIPIPAAMTGHSLFAK
ncbi:MAG: 2,3-bisphosphoglycerate-independent phosphoglycerate mutase [Labilithrix sp.]|nr:2,3-bisphosphoglycerate-independent phosphoglycerate mutase [Labilithrix sp.]MCW5810166.1 2,3-bisphosphoglycerate-independent phosphoglycerate mutase [Labilithrix sp.]